MTYDDAPGLTHDMEPMCFAYKHLGEDIDPDAYLPDDVTPMSISCAALPKGIPTAIFVNSGDHYEPIGGEVEIKGKPIVFELQPGEEYALRNRETALWMSRETMEEVLASMHEACHEVQKFNPYHDQQGRFTTAQGDACGGDTDRFT